MPLSKSLIVQVYSVFKLFEVYCVFKSALLKSPKFSVRSAGFSDEQRTGQEQSALHGVSAR